ncbi:Tetratricopeptide repeat protein 1 [Histomonas meleagridis]|uniref:Tetratricopeptide repeat protein 1 n=1 Tax=Histomonas meleagridis TaxID=135588 RepID=UPI00355A5BBF|nr:Tetratricopeptide repeat protein 1 [Histomonas meleagridis]KAH0801467.1 Tetratricopeptide repeat protein 1 [Histomonas meleagridis]
MSLEEILSIKEEGNQNFRNKEYEKALNLYSDAIFKGELLGDELDSEIKAALYSNRAACFMSLNKVDECLSDAEHGLSLKTPYPRCRLRKYWALRKKGKANDALAELKKAIEEDPSLEASYSVEMKEVQKEADAETEKMKNEALSQLKDLGNKFLGLFGMSTDNFKFQQNPDGGYNIQLEK